MVFAIRAMTVERGLDPREFVVFSYGGGGGLFAAAVAEELEVPAVLVPRAPANFSAWGILTSDYREDVAVTTVRPLDESSAAEAAAILRQLAEEAAANLERYGFAEGQVERIYRADIRYAGQDHAITVPLEPEWLDDHPRAARRRAAALRRRAYPAVRARHTRPAARARYEPRRAVGHIARPSVSEPATLEQAAAAGVPAGVLRRTRPASRPRSTSARRSLQRRRPGDRRGVGDDGRGAARLVARTPTGSGTCCSRESDRRRSTSSPPRSCATRLASASLEMNKTLRRTAYNPLLYDVQDFGLGIVSAEGLLWGEAPGQSMFIGALSDTIKTGLAKHGPEGFREGDVLIANDPFLTGTHISDTSVYVPIFAEGELVAFAEATAHWADIGGKSPGGWCPDSTDVYQEGICFSHQRLFRAGRAERRPARGDRPERALPDTRARRSRRA